MRAVLRGRRADGYLGRGAIVNAVVVGAVHYAAGNAVDMLWYLIEGNVVHK